MPIRDVSEMNALLDNYIGATAGPNSPATWDLALFDGDPMLDGVELDETTAPGYARVSVANDATWTAAADGQKSTAAPVEFPPPTDAWIEATHWGAFRGGTEVMGPTAALTEPLEITAASAEGPSVSPVIFVDDSVETSA